jgi:hypothetical protein
MLEFEHLALLCSTCSPECPLRGLGRRGAQDMVMMLRYGRYVFGFSLDTRMYTVVSCGGNVLEHVERMPLSFLAQCLGCRHWSCKTVGVRWASVDECPVSGHECRVSVNECPVSGHECRVSVNECPVSGHECRVSVNEFPVAGHECLVSINE